MNADPKIHRAHTAISEVSEYINELKKKISDQDEELILLRSRIIELEREKKDAPV